MITVTSNELLYSSNEQFCSYSLNSQKKLRNKNSDTQIHVVEDSGSVTDP